jgi:hypothetical protein
MNPVELAPVPITMAICEVAKRLGLPAKFIPLFSIAVGIILALGFQNFEINFTNIVTGIVYGCSAVGIYSGVKNTIEPQPPIEE